MSAPGSIWRSNPLARGFYSPDLLIKGIVALNVAMFAISLLFNPMGTRMSLNPLTALAPSDNSLLLLGATGTLPIDRFGRWWTLLAANYLHGGLLHILFNMLAMRQLAQLVAREFGTYRLAVIYTVGGVAGFLASYAAGVPLTIGASAAVCSLMGALVYYGRSRGGVYGRIIYRQVGGWVVALFIFGLIVPGINNWGHAGGLLAGGALGLLLGYSEKTPENRSHRFLAGICTAATLLVLVWAVGTGVYYRWGA
jgi:rhomboid protease GluP